jgi:hypothetical protein
MDSLSLPRPLPLVHAAVAIMFVLFRSQSIPRWLTGYPRVHFVLLGRNPQGTC